MARSLAAATGASVKVVARHRAIDPGGDEDPFAGFYAELQARAQRELADGGGDVRKAASPAAPPPWWAAGGRPSSRPPSAAASTSW